MRCGCRQATRTTRRSSWCAVTPGLTPSGRVELAIYVVEEGWPLRRASRPAVSGLDAHRGALGPALPTAGPVAACDRGNARPVFAGRGAAPADPPANGPPDRALHAPAAGNRPESSPISACAPSRSSGAARACHWPSWTWSPGSAAGPGPALRTRRARHLVHVDIKNLGKIPNGGGHLTQGRQQGKRSRQATAPEARGYGYLHTALDDHSRAGLHRDPRRRARRHGFWRRAVDLVRQRRRHRRKPWWSAAAGAMSWSSGRRVRRRAGRLLAERGQRASRTAGRQESDEVLTSTTWWTSGVLRVRR